MLKIDKLGHFAKMFQKHIFFEVRSENSTILLRIPWNMYTVVGITY